MTEDLRGQLEALLMDIALADDEDKRMELWGQAMKLLAKMKTVSTTLH